MELRAVELIRIPVPLVAPFRTSHGTTTTRDVLVLRVITDAADGWAECVAPADPTYTGDYVDAAEHALANYLVPAVLGAVVGPVSIQNALEAMAGIRGQQMARAALEVAITDALLRGEHTSLAAHIGVTAGRVPAGVAIGMAADLDALLCEVDARVGEGYSRVKLKVMPGWDERPVAAVRERHPNLILVADANGAYAAGDARTTLPRLDAYGLACLEQPLGERDLVGHAALATQLRTPICLDEAISCYDDLDAALALGSCSVVNLKIGRVGGLREAVRIHDRCVGDGIGLWCGGMLETGLGRALNVALAALPGFTQPGDLSASNRFFAADLTEPFELLDGCIAVPRGPGLGVQPLAHMLARRTSTQTIRP